ncbi:MAG: hypothetical protein HY207_01210 [Nitrospirae bacterium]|nr:hypothetical protein [Nitrospirota bacterium]
MATCIYCHRAKGKRSCPALTGLICSRCCGEHRLVRIACPADCVHLTAHETYQRGRSAPEFAAERAHLVQGLKDREAAVSLTALEAVIFRHFAARPTALDGEAIAVLESIRRRLSPLRLSEPTRSPLADAVWKDLEPFLKEVNRQAAAEAVEAYLVFARSFSGAGLQSRHYLTGLFGFLEQHDPDLVRELRTHDTPEAGRIISG